MQLKMIGEVYRAKKNSNGKTVALIERVNRQWNGYNS